PGCQWVSCVQSEHADVVTGHWKDGRIGTVRGHRPTSSYGFTTFVDGAATNVACSTGGLYGKLVDDAIATFKTGKPAVPPETTTEIVRFIAKAQASADNHGMPMDLY
ncbi:MAG: Gfo/Idh/MocA family protein, partial [Planctomycetia bacterium]